MIPKNKVINAEIEIVDLLPPFPDFNKLYTAVHKIVTGIKNSTRLGSILTLSKTAKTKAKVCPKVKTETSVSIFFQSLK